MTVIPITIGTLGKRIGKGTGRLGNKGTNWEHLDNKNIKIGQNPGKIPGDLRKLPTIQNTMETISSRWHEKL